MASSYLVQSTTQANNLAKGKKNAFNLVSTEFDPAAYLCAMVFINSRSAGEYATVFLSVMSVMSYDVFCFKNE